MVTGGGDFIKNYFEKQNEYEKKYGTNTVVLIQKGTFYEIYGVYNEDENIGKAREISNLLNITLTSSNKSIETCSRQNPNMTGIPKHTLKKYLRVLIENNYTVVVIDENEDNTSERTISQIYSPGTYDDESYNSVCISGIYISDDFNLYVCNIDISIGTNTITELIHGDNNFKLEELYRLIHSNNPSETVIFSKSSNNEYINKVIKYINVYNTIVNLSNTETSENYISQFVGKIYGSNIAGNIIETEISRNSKISLCHLINYIYEHNENIINIIQEPIYNTNNNLIIYNNGIHQLNITNHTNNKSNKSLYDLLCKCYTHMGKRLFRKNLTSPYSDTNFLNKKYDEIDKTIKSHKLHFLNSTLKNICDIERVFYKLKNFKITKDEFKQLLISCSTSYDILFETDFLDFCSNRRELLSNLKKFNDEMCEKIDIYSTDSSSNFFRSGIYKDLDDNFKNIDSSYKWINSAIKRLSKYLNKNNEFIKYDYKNNIIYTTQAKAKILKTVVFDEAENTFFGSSLQINSDKSKAVISSLNINSKIHNIIKDSTNFNSLETSFIHNFYEYVYSSFKNIIINVSSIIANIDVIVNNCNIALNYNYCKPEAIDSEFSFIDAFDLRHALIELLDNKTEYIPNDVSINANENKKGILLYGVNGSGKSCYGKAIGISIIMAQMGMYVPASKFTFCPYNKLFTRISCDDNIFKGHSSFFVEMSELRSIINFMDNKSIVLGDEICKGTESVSALGIVGATMYYLLNNNVSFVFATHLHKLPELSILKNIDGLIIKHIEVEFDKSNAFLKYTRKIKNGVCDSVYGLEIADYIIQNKNFFKTAYTIRNEVIAKPKLLSTKKSKYNSSIFVDSCAICSSNNNLDIHHIEHQSTTSNNSGTKTNKTKNDRSNLVTLCKICHNKHHSGYLDIKGWVHTSNGYILDYVSK